MRLSSVAGNRRWLQAKAINPSPPAQLEGNGATAAKYNHDNPEINPGG
jgi:hypothetical protein